jgi:hypothetical protein
VSLLQPTEEDDAFAAGHAKAGWNKAVRRCMRLRRLLEQARPTVTNARLAADIDVALKQTLYDESDAFPAGAWDKES